jgi:hypothetical protein
MALRYMGFDGDFYLLKDNKARVNVCLCAEPLVLSSAVVLHFKQKDRRFAPRWPLVFARHNTTQSELHFLRRFFKRPTSRHSDQQK